METIWQFFFSTDANQIIGTFVNLAIIALCVGGVVELFLATNRLREDAKGLDRFDHQVRGKSESGSILELSRSLPGAHILARRVQILADLHAAGADLEPATLSALAVAELDRQARFSRWAAGTVVLLGLAGTLLGLSQAVLRAQPMLGQIVSGPQAVQAVIGTFSGLGTAFSTTLMGIVAAVILGLALGRFRLSQGRYLQRMEEVCLVRVFPYFRTSPALAMVEAAKQLTALEQKLAAALQEIVSQVKTQGLALTKTVEVSIGDLTLDARNTGNKLRESVETAMTHIVRETQERGVALTSTVDRSFANLTEELSSGTTELLARFEATHSTVARLLGDPGADPQTLSAILTRLKEGVDSINVAVSRMNETAPALEEVMARQLDRQSRDQHEALHVYTGRIGASVERQETVHEEGFRRLEQGIDGFGETLFSRLKDHDDGLYGGLGTRVTEIAEAVRSQAGNLADLRAASARLAEAAGSLTSRGLEDREAAREIKEATHLLTSQLADLGTQVERMFARLEAVARPQYSDAVVGAQGGGSSRDGHGFGAPPNAPVEVQSVPTAKSSGDLTPRVPYPTAPVSGTPPKKSSLLARLFGS